MCPHWSKVLWRGPWTGTKVCSSLPAPFWQSTSFTHTFVVWQETLHNIDGWTNVQQALGGRLVWVMMIKLVTKQDPLPSEPLNQLPLLYRSVVFWIWTHLHSCDKRIPVIWEKDVPASHSLKPLCRLFPWMFLAPVIQVDYVSLIWDLEKI